MKRVTIPGTALNVAPICLGTGNMGTAISVEESSALLDQLIALGGNFIDTAHVYGDWIPGTKGLSEKAIGAWLQSSGLRAQVVIGTKGGHPALSSMNVSRLSRAEIVQDIHESLDYLRTDVIDLYWLHRDDTAIPVGEIIDILNEQVAAGTIRDFGASNWTIPRIQAALDYAAGKGVPSFVANQPRWSLALPDMAQHPDKTIVAMDETGIEFHRRTGMAVIPYSSQAHGFFSKLDSVGRSGIRAGDLALYDSPINGKRFAAARDLARRYGVSINEIALAYLLAQPFPTIPIVGSKRGDQLADSFKASDLALTPDDLAYLEANDGA
ncbi:MAG TPA: aldo/keto reductase [Phototrophicaceae bacterium]|nr:aldo/keto reductase [Phototrophicaceae bacterium]